MKQSHKHEKKGKYQLFRKFSVQVQSNYGLYGYDFLKQIQNIPYKIIHLIISLFKFTKSNDK